jgi:hypothetical protein
MPHNAPAKPPSSWPCALPLAIADLSLLNSTIVREAVVLVAFLYLWNQLGRRANWPSAVSTVRPACQSNCRAPERTAGVVSEILATQRTGCRPGMLVFHGAKSVAPAQSQSEAAVGCQHGAAHLPVQLHDSMAVYRHATILSEAVELNKRLLRNRGAALRSVQL